MPSSPSMPSFSRRPNSPLIGGYPSSVRRSPGMPSMTPTRAGALLFRSRVPRLPRRYLWVALSMPLFFFFYLLSSSSSRTDFAAVASSYADAARRRPPPEQGAAALKAKADELPPSIFGIQLPDRGRKGRTEEEPADPRQQLQLSPPVLRKKQFNDAFVPLEPANTETKLVGGMPGFYLFENLYTHKGVLYAVTSQPSSLPDVSKIVSIREQVADETFWKVISPSEAKDLFGERVARLTGDTIFFGDGPPVSFLDHYYHFVVEVFSGAWRVLTSTAVKSSTDSGSGSALSMSPPERVIFPREVKWRDGPGLNAWFLNTVIPTAAIEEMAAWDDRASSGNVYQFERIVIVDRWASHRHNPTANQWNKMNSDIYEIPAPKDWWEPLRQSLMYSLQIPDEPLSDKPVITYVNRQSTSRRKLRDEDHDALMEALSELEAEGLAQVYDARMETIGKKEQFALSSRTNILLGVHGNGLSHLMWMKSGSHVIEIFYPEGFTRDYQLITEPLGHQHYAVWNDTVQTESAWRTDGTNHFPSEFQGTEIPVSAAFIKELLLEIIHNEGRKFIG